MTEKKRKISTKKQSQLTPLELLEILSLLVKKYGKKLTLKSYQDKISELNQEIGQAIQTFGPLGLLNTKKLSEQIRIFKQKTSEQKQFLLSGSVSELEPRVRAYLEEHFENINLKTEEKSGSELSIQLKGEGYIFSRSLDEDLERLLKSETLLS